MNMREINPVEEMAFGRKYVFVKEVHVDGIGPKVAVLKGFSESGFLGVEVESTEMYKESDAKARKQVREGFHKAAGELLEKDMQQRLESSRKLSEAEPYNQPFLVIPSDESAEGIVKDVTAYSSGRIDSLQELGGKDIFYKERFDNVRAWAGRHPKAAKTIKWTLIGVGIGAAVYCGIQCYNAIQNAATQAANMATQKGIMNTNIGWEQMWGYVLDGVITPGSQVYDNVVAGHAAYQAASAAYQSAAVAQGAALTGAVTTGAIAAGAGTGSAVGIIHPIKSGAKVKLSSADKEVGKYFQDNGGYQVLPVNTPDIKQYALLAQK